MTHYPSFWDWLFSTEAVASALTYAALGAIVCFIFLMWRRFPFVSPFFSSYFVLALCPFVFTAILALMRVHQFLDGGDFAQPYTEGRLRGPVQFAITGASLSLIALCLYSTLYAFSRRKRNDSSP